MRALIAKVHGRALGVLLCAGVLAGCGGSGEIGYRLEPVGEFAAPTWVGQPPGEPDLLLVAERPGRIVALREGRRLRRPFLDLRRMIRVRDRRGQGLLSVAFAPDYPDSGVFYVSYTDRSGALRLDEVKRSPESAASADPRSRRTLLRIPSRFTQSNGGHLLFGPRDRLYISVGDGGYPPGGEGTDAEDPSRLAQDKSSLRGKILRIAPDPSSRRGFSVPGDNPYVGKRGNDLAFAYGLRDPWRFSYDPETQTWQITDVGSRTYEEIDMLPRLRLRGANFGWSALEGPLPYRDRVRELRGEPAQRPIRAYAHDPGCAVVGGFVVADEELTALENEYLYGDFCSGELRSFDVTDKAQARIDEPIGLSVPRLTALGEDGAGRVYLAVAGAPGEPGRVYRLRER